MPEAQIILSQAVSYIASAPKSNAACVAIDRAMDTVARTKTPPVPAHLQDAHYQSSEKLGRGTGYKYAHAYPHHYVSQQYLPDALENEVFYEPSDNGYEQTIRTYLDHVKQWKHEQEEQG